MRGERREERSDEATKRYKYLRDLRQRYEQLLFRLVAVAFSSLTPFALLVADAQSEGEGGRGTQEEATDDKRVLRPRGQVGSHK